MAESGRGANAVAERPGDPACEIAALRLIGAQLFDPVRFHFIEALARRTSPFRDDVKRLLDGRLSEALAAYRERFEAARDDARATVARATDRAPEAAGELQGLFAAGDFRAVRRLAAGLEKDERHGPLADLTRQLAQHSPADGGSRPELKTLRYFRNTWSKLSVDRQLAQAIEQAPQNAGPLNSQRLVLSSLALMREVSPDYLNRFVSYVDTLLWLDQAETKDGPPVKKSPAAKASRKIVRDRSP